MKIGLQTWGTTGDIRPFLALAGGLSGAGHDVSLVITCADRIDFSSSAQRMGFALSQVGSLAYDEQTISRLAEDLRKTKIPLK